MSLTLLSCVIYSAITLMVAYTTEDSVLENMLVTAKEQIETQPHLVLTPQLMHPALRLYPEDSHVPSFVLPSMFSRDHPLELFTDTDAHFHLIGVDLPQGKKGVLVLDATKLLAVRNSSSDLFSLALGALAITLCLSVWLAFRLSQHSIQPIVELAQSVENYANLADLPYHLTYDNDELHFLAESIENCMKALSDALSREIHFTRDVSHELRTSLTAMSNTLQLARLRRLTNEDLDALTQHVNTMQRTVETLLALARVSSLEKVNFAFLPLFESCILQLSHLLDSHGILLNIETPETPMPDWTGSPHLIHLLLTNLVTNSIRFSNQATIDIRISKSQFVITNQTDTPRPEKLMSPASKSRHSSGIGQGLFLSKRIVDQLGWTLDIHTSQNTFSVCVTATYTPEE